MLFMVLCLAVRDMAPWISLYPPEWVLPIAPAIDSISTAVTEFVKPVFRGIAWLMGWPMRGVQAVLQWIPWPIMLVLVGITALRAGGRSLAWFALGTLLYLLAAGYWHQSMARLPPYYRGGTPPSIIRTAGVHFSRRRARRSASVSPS